MRFDFDQIAIPQAAFRSSSRVQTGAGAVVFFFPDYSGGSPYFRLLYGKNGYGAQYYCGSIERAIQAIESRSTEAPVIFHLHWLNWMFKDVRKNIEAKRRVCDFIERLRYFKSLGGYVIWTIHNEVEHEAAFIKSEIFLRRQLSELSDRIHVHDMASASSIKAYEIPMGKVIEVPHGHYIGVYPDTVTRHEARERLNLDGDDTVCLFLGRLGRYKGADKFIEAFRKAFRDCQGLKLVMAGQARHGYDPFERLAEPLSEHEQSSIRFYKGFVDDSHLQVFFRAADVAVIPYRKVLTSGSLMLALSFGTPVAAPDFPIVRSVLVSDDLGKIIARPGTKEQFRRVLLDLACQKHTRSLGMKSDAWAEFERRYRWRDFSVEVVKPVVEGG